MNRMAKQALLGCYRATLSLQYSLSCHAKEPLSPSNSGCIGVENRPFLEIIGSKTKQNPTKTAKQISKTDFYFVKHFYRLCDICMRHEVHAFFRHEDMKTGFFI